MSDTEKQLTNRQRRFIQDAVKEWCESHFPNMIEADFIAICNIQWDFHFKAMLETMQLVKRSKEWRVPKSLIRARAADEFLKEAHWYKDAGEWGKRPSDIRIERDVERSLAPFFKKHKED